jgi:hypothetical protein
MVYPRNSNLKTQFPNTDTREMHQVMECMSICRTCAKKCMEEGHKQLALLCLDCSDICDLVIKLKSSESEYCQQVLELCAYACRHCANECNHMPSQHCQECAEVCRRCAEACSRLPTYH